MPSQVGIKRAGWVSHPILTAPYEVGWQPEAWQEAGAHARGDPKSVAGRVQRTNGHVAPGAATAAGDVNALRSLLPGHLLSVGGPFGDRVPEQVEKEWWRNSSSVSLITPASQSPEAWRLRQVGGLPAGPATSPHSMLVAPPASFPKEQGRNSFIILMSGSGIPHRKMPWLDESQAARLLAALSHLQSGGGGR